MKECFAITTYCNTEEKLKALNRTIENISKFGFPIFLHGHYPLPLEIQKKVHSYFYNSENPVLNFRWNLFWYFVDNYKFEIKVYDLSYTVLKAWRESIKILDDFDKIHMINYDTNLTTEIFDLSRKYSQSVFLQIKPDFTGKNYTVMIYYCLNKKSFQYFTENLTLEKYLQFRTIPEIFLPIPEEYISSFIVGDDFIQVPWTEFDGQKLVEYDVVSENRTGFDSLMRTENVDIFIGEYNGMAHIYFFNCKKEIEISVPIFFHAPNPGDLMGTHFGGKVSSNQLFPLDRPFKDISELQVYIDGKPLEQEFIQKFFKLECKIFDR